MSTLFTSESVSEGHPDKIADGIADSILDAMLAIDPMTRICCEVFVTTNKVIVGGELRTKAEVAIDGIVREKIRKIGYTDPSHMFSDTSVSIENLLHTQSADIQMGVDKDEEDDQGAGDQGIIFGYATNEVPENIPATLYFSHRCMKKLTEIRKTEPELMPYLGPDAKAQVTMEYDVDGHPRRVHSLLISTQHSDFTNASKKIKEDIQKYLLPRVFKDGYIDKNTNLFVNPTGRFVYGGPHADAGLTNRKIIIDTYGGKGAHGGGGMSGKDASKVDRSSAYYTRYLAKNFVRAGLADSMIIQVSYAIGMSSPISLYVNTSNTSKLSISDDKVSKIMMDLFDFKPRAIERTLDLRSPMYEVTSSYGHMGREYDPGNSKVGSPALFTWEKLDLEATMTDEFSRYLK